MLNFSSLVVKNKAVKNMHGMNKSTIAEARFKTMLIQLSLSILVIASLIATPTVLHASAATRLVVDNVDLNYYLPKNLVENNAYNTDIIKPKSVLNFEVGQWHARHDQVIQYMRNLAAQSERVSIIEMGTTWEQRPQILVVITSKENQDKLQEIINSRKLTESNDSTNQQLVVWLGYSVHGNEASGTNASMITAYHLAAKQGDAHQKFLQDSIVLIEPSLNPDGYGRFSNWANNNRSTHLSKDVYDREHREDWPGGRTNHYRFDLNRDWLLAQQPESKARLKWYHQFRPHVLGDFHEMGSNSSYFFQPGVPSRQNPLTPDENFELTDSIAKYHAKILDEAGSLYYSKENYDDYYYGKGSTYPDINGSIGILFEQASVRGHLRDTINGPMSFPFAVKNHFLTSLSTLEGAYANKDRLIDYQQRFFDQSKTAARNDNSKAIIVSNDGDPTRMAAFIDILLRHQIKIYALAEPMTINGLKISEGIIIPFNQPQYRLIKSLFETRTQFKDNTFYDVSSWTLPHAFNLPYAMLTRKGLKTNIRGKLIRTSQRNVGVVSGKAKVAYSINWNNYSAAAASNYLLELGINLRVARKAFTTDNLKGKTSFDAGTIVVPVGIQSVSSDTLYALMQKVAERFHLAISAIDSGYAKSGIDIGSDSMGRLKPVRPVLLTGSGTSGYDTGELWHLFDQRLAMNLTQAKITDFSKLALNKYTHLLLANGNYGALTEKNIVDIKSWVKAGGVLIAMKSASQWVSENKIIDVSFVIDEEEKLPAKKSIAYTEMDDNDASVMIGGSIFATDIDITHPLAYGYQRKFLPVFRNHQMIMNPSNNQYATVVRYRKSALLSGYVSDDNLEKISNSAMMIAERKSSGAVILILDNPVFRGFWYGTSRLLINSLFFGTSFKSPNN